MRVWAYWNQQFAIPGIQKVFNLSEFFRLYPAALNSRQKQVMKAEFIHAVECYLNFGLIEDKFQVIVGEQFQSVDKITLQNISQGFVIYEKINFNLLKLK